ncbi:MAG: sugar ABC transporter substrate-binding protein [Lachnospiraceae bacterium]|nr:sugar ABC transporter substrate-binding protein [Lachnospiraceae bacterium]
MKTLSRRDFMRAALMSGTALASMGLVGCSSSDGGSQDTGGTSESSTAAGNGTTAQTTSEEEITLAFWTLALTPTYTDYIQGLIDAYEEEHPNITIEWQDLPWDGIQDKFLAQTAGGNPPDVVNIWSQLALTYGGKGALLDLEEYVTEEQKSIYLESAYDSARLGDSVYALPWYATPNITVYNTELFDQAGITEVPKTYDELFDAAVEFHDKTGAYLFTPSTVFHMFYAYGIEMLDESKTTATFNNEEALELLNRLKEVGDAGAIQTDPGTWDNWDNDRQLYANEKLAMIVGGAQTVTRLRDEAGEDIMNSTAVCEAVVGPANVSAEAIMKLVVSSGSKHPEEAIDFANFVTNDENQLDFCKLVSIFPTTKVASQDEFFQSDMETLEGLASYYCSISAQNATDMTLGISQDEDVKGEIDNIMDMIFASDMTPQEALDAAEESVNALLQEQ